MRVRARARARARARVARATSCLVVLCGLAEREKVAGRLEGGWRWRPGVDLPEVRCEQLRPPQLRTVRLPQLLDGG